MLLTLRVVGEMLLALGIVDEMLQKLQVVVEMLPGVDKKLLRPLPFPQSARHNGRLNELGTSPYDAHYLHFFLRLP